MSAIQSEPRMIPCLEFGCRHGRIWKAGITHDMEEMVRRIKMRQQKTPEYFEETETCSVCKGAGEVENPGVKR